MIKLGLFFTIIMVVINAGLFLTGDISDNGAFRDLSSSLNLVAPVNSQTNVVGNSENSIASGEISSGITGLAGRLFSIGISVINISTFLLTGSIGIIQKIDPTNSFALIILAPIAVVQVFYIAFIFIAIIQALASALARLF